MRLMAVSDVKRESRWGLAGLLRDQQNAISPRKGFSGPEIKHRDCDINSKDRVTDRGLLAGSFEP